MKLAQPFLLRINIVLAVLLGGLLASTSTAQNYRVLERDADGDVTTRIAEAQEPQDGIDPVTYHELFSQPSDEGDAQILWVASDKPIKIDRQAIEDAGGYPMVVSAFLPDGSDLEYRARSIASGQVVPAFTHTASGPDWSINQARLAALPEGLYDIQVSIRMQGEPETRARQRVEISGKGKENELERPDNNGERPDRIEPTPVPIDPIDVTPLIEWELPEDGRIIYVSSSNGNDARDGRTPQTAVRSLDRGYALMRDGRPDWLLIKRGDTFELPHDENGDFRTWHKSGPSPLEPMIIGTYGDAEAPRPRLNTNGQGGIKHLHVANLVIRDLHIYANRRDPNSRSFDGGDGDREIGFHMVRAEDVVIQGCLIEFCHTNVMLRQDGDHNDTRLRGIRFHRCTIRNAYDHDGRDSQGMYCKTVAGIVISECVFDHNGYNEQIDGSYRTGRSHNLYFSDCTQVTLEGNVFARESYLSVKFRCETEGFCRDTVIRDNLFIGCAYPLEFGANGDEDAINYVGISMTNNVFARTTGWPIDAPRNLAVKITRAADVVVDGNLFCDNGPRGSDRNEAVRASANHALEDILITNNDAFLPTPEGDDMFSTHYRERRRHNEISFRNNRENIDADLYVDPTVTLEGYLATRGVNRGGLGILMLLFAQESISDEPRVSISDMVRYYRDGFTLVNGH